VMLAFERTNPEHRRGGFEQQGLRAQSGWLGAHG
jgi:hypothetical protein